MPGTLACPGQDGMRSARSPSSTAAHGSRDMPMWGTLFSSVSAGSGFVDIRVRNLRDYLESIQEK